MRDYNRPESHRIRRETTRQAREASRIREAFEAFGAEAEAEATVASVLYREACRMARARRREAKRLAAERAAFRAEASARGCL